MALDYYLEIDEYGTQDRLNKLRSFIRNEFSFPDDEKTKIMLGNGLGINFFVDDDNDNESVSSITPVLTISFRVDKMQLREQGYKLLRQVVQKVLDNVETNLRLTDEYNDDIFLKRESGKTSKMHLDHDIWQVGEG